MGRNNTVAIPRGKLAKLTSLTSPLTDESRWRLVLAHASTTEFLYGVVSTRIFCRASCPSRRPRRANVRFFDSATSAAAAGFRACRRCRPESTDPSHESPRASAEKQVKSACDYLRGRNGDVQMLDLAAHAGLSPRYFHGLFKQITGLTPGAYAAAVRLESMEKRPGYEEAGFEVQDVVSQVVDCVRLAPVDAGRGVSLRDSTRMKDGGVPDIFDTDFGSIDLDLNLDMDLERIDHCDSFEQSTDAYASNCVDPSLLSLPAIWS